MSKRQGREYKPFGEFKGTLEAEKKKFDDVTEKDIANVDDEAQGWAIGQEYHTRRPFDFYMNEPAAHLDAYFNRRPQGVLGQEDTKFNTRSALLWHIVHGLSDGGHLWISVRVEPGKGAVVGPESVSYYNTRAWSLFQTLTLAEKIWVVRMIKRRVNGYDREKAIIWEQRLIHDRWQERRFLNSRLTQPAIAHVMEFLKGRGCDMTPGMKKGFF